MGALFLIIAVTPYAADLCWKPALSDLSDSPSDGEYIMYDLDVIETDTLPRHGSPQDRGSADAYYGRPYDPHYYVGATYNSERVEKDNMTVGEIEAYKYGYDNEEDRKDWG